MLSNTTDKSSPSLNPHNIFSAEDQQTGSHESEHLPLFKKVTNTTADKTRCTVLVHPQSNREVTSQNSLLKKVLIGTTILAAGCFVGHMVLRRMGTDGRAESRDPINKIPDFALSDRTQMLLQPLALTNELSDEAPLKSQETTTPSTSHSPYSYYEKKYEQNNASSPLAVTALGNLTVPYKESTSPILTEENNIKQTVFDISRHLHTIYPQENGHDFFYDSLPQDQYFPLGKILYEELESFCNRKMKKMITRAYNTRKPAKRCAFLAIMVDKIDEAAAMDNFSRSRPRNRNLMSTHRLEIMNRRELTTLLLAAECIIEHKNYDLFYSTAMTDHKNYTIEEIIKRERNIMSYFPAYYDDCKTGVSKYNLSDRLDIRPDGSLIKIEKIPPTGVTVLTIDKSLAASSVINISEYLSVRYPHENNRNIFYDTIPRDQYYPLGKSNYKELKKFCENKVKNIMVNAYNSTIPAERCALLAKMVLAINESAGTDSHQRMLDNELMLFSPAVHGGEIYNRRRLTTLLLAAEYIIQHKNYDLFYPAAMADHKDYSIEEIVTREQNIMSYFSSHYNDCKSGIAEYGLSSRIAINTDGSLIYV